MPIWLKSFIVDFAETGLAAVFALTLVIPGSIEEGQTQALILGTAILGALIAAARRAVPGFIAWLNAKLGTGA
jgi:hypothetical protein